MFTRATKSSIKIRFALSGAAGSGKTFSALNIASYLGTKVALIDTEFGSASKYADLFKFDTCKLADHHPQKYIAAIQTAERAGYEVIIIDSLSHAWFAELELAGKGFDGWKNVRPIERKLIEAMLVSSAHIIATMRSKTEWVMEEYKANDGKTKSKPKKIGTAPVQSSGIEYEFDIAGELDYQHILSISKSRCPQLTDRTFLNPGKELADILLDWAGPVVSGSDRPVIATTPEPPQPQQPVQVMPPTVKNPPATSQQPQTAEEAWRQWRSPDDAFQWAANFKGITPARAAEIYESIEPEIIRGREVKSIRFEHEIRNLTKVF